MKWILEYTGKQKDSYNVLTYKLTNTDTGESISLYNDTLLVEALRDLGVREYANYQA